MKNVVDKSRIELLRGAVRFHLRLECGHVTERTYGKRAAKSGAPDKVKCKECGE